MARWRLNRLDENRYLGRSAVAFTACLTNRTPYFTSEETVSPHRLILQEQVLRYGCIAYAYCFMPDHLHVIVLGVTDDSNPKEAFIRFKQRSGYILRNTDAKWQPRFYDHILRANEDTPRQVLYVLNNPLRAGLTDEPLSYPFSRSIGIEFSEVLETVLDL